MTFQGTYSNATAGFVYWIMTFNKIIPVNCPNDHTILQNDSMFKLVEIQDPMQVSSSGTTEEFHHTVLNCIIRG